MELLTQAQQRSSLGWVQGAKAIFDCTPLLNNALKKHWGRVFEKSLTGMVENKWAWPGERLEPCRHRFKTVLRLHQIAHVFL
jgi:hypothetical protein